MNLLRLIRSKFKPYPKPLLTENETKELDKAIRSLDKAAGHVVKHTRRPEYKPDVSRHGGRIVKAMPHSLQQIKQAQEKVADVE